MNSFGLRTSISGLPASSGRGRRRGRRGSATRCARRRGTWSAGNWGTSVVIGAALVDPELAAAVQIRQSSVAEELERPEGVAGPPVRLVAVEDDGGVGGDALGPGQRGELLGVDVVADELVLEVPLPVDLDRARGCAPCRRAGRPRRSRRHQVAAVESPLLDCRGQPFRGHQAAGRRRRRISRSLERGRIVRWPFTGTVRRPGAECVRGAGPVTTLVTGWRDCSTGFIRGNVVFLTPAAGP